MREETIEEFLARGGKIKKIPSQVIEESEPVVKVTSTPEIGHLSLGDGEFYFSEPRKFLKKRKVVRLSDVLDKFELPKEIADRLRGV